MLIFVTATNSKAEAYYQYLCGAAVLRLLTYLRERRQEEQQLARPPPLSTLPPLEDDAPQVMFLQNPHDRLATGQLAQTDFLDELHRHLDILHARHLVRVILHKNSSWGIAGRDCHNYMGRQLRSETLWTKILADEPFVGPAKDLRLTVRQAPKESSMIRTAETTWHLLLLGALEAGLTTVLRPGPAMNLPEDPLEEPPLEVEDACRLTRAEAWASWDTFCHEYRDTLPDMVWATKALSNRPIGVQAGDRPAPLQWDDKFEQEDEPLHFLRDVYAPCILRGLFLGYTQRGEKSHPTWDLIRGTKVLLRTGSIEGALLDLQLLPDGPPFQLLFHTLSPLPRTHQQKDPAQEDPPPDPWTLQAHRPVLISHAMARDTPSGPLGLREEPREQLTLSPGMSGITIVEGLSEREEHTPWSTTPRFFLPFIIRGAPPASKRTKKGQVKHRVLFNNARTYDHQQQQVPLDAEDAPSWKDVPTAGLKELQLRVFAPKAISFIRSLHADHAGDDDDLAETLAHVWIHHMYVFPQVPSVSRHTTCWDNTPGELAKALLGKGRIQPTSFQDTELHSLVLLSEWETLGVLPDELPPVATPFGPRPAPKATNESHAHPTIQPPVTRDNLTARSRIRGALFGRDGNPRPFLYLLLQGWMMGLRIQALLGYGGSGKTHFYAALMLVAAPKLPGLLLYVAETNAACTEFMSAIIFMADAANPASANWQKLKIAFLRIGRRRVRDKRHELRELATEQGRDIYLKGADLSWEDLQRLEGIKILAITKDMLGYLVQKAESYGISLMKRVTLVEVDESTQMTEGDAVPLLSLLTQHGLQLLAGDPHQKPLDRIERSPLTRSLMTHNILLQLMEVDTGKALGALPALVTECHRFTDEIREMVTQLGYTGLTLADPRRRRRANSTGGSGSTPIGRTEAPNALSWTRTRYWRSR